PARNRIFYFLRSNEECTDLNNLSRVSTHFYHGVHEFMKKEHNRPGICELDLEKIYNGMKLEVLLFPANIAFYDLSNLGIGRFKKSMTYDMPTLEVTLTGGEDPIIEQVADILSSSINNVRIDEMFSVFSSSGLPLCAKLLASSTIGDLNFRIENLDDDMTPIIMSILSKATGDLYITVYGQLQVNDPEAFVRALNSSSASEIALYNSHDLESRFFNLPLTFWEKFINEKLSNGSFKW
ncbi:hypothetical protein PMAYCL1PPCAC_27165, partial [Pristionchus mayeri]